MNRKMKVLISAFLAIAIFLGGYFAWNKIGGNSSFGTMNKIEKTNDSPEEMINGKDKSKKKTDQDIANLYITKKTQVDENQKRILIDFLNTVGSTPQTDVTAQEDLAINKTLGNTEYFDEIWRLTNEDHLHIDESKITIGASQSEKNKGNAMFVPYLNDKNEMKAAVYLEYIPTAESIHISDLLAPEDIDGMRQ